MAEINRENKDRLFRFIFGREENKAWTLSLYNAINGTDYNDPNKITVTTIEDALYMSMKNDLSILLRNFMNFYEQQSTYNPNEPLRFLIYAGMIYSKYVENKANRINIYSTKQQMLPIPKMVCFYNGTAEMPDRSELHLASAFPEGADPDIAVKVTMLNINYGRNKALLDACRPLRDYAWLVDRIRYYQKIYNDIEKAVDMAVAELPEESVIKPYIMANRAEVKRMCITEYDEAWTMELFKEEAYEDGIEKGIEKGMISNIKTLTGTMNWTAQQAMDALKIPASDRQRYLAML